MLSKYVYVRTSTWRFDCTYLKKRSTLEVARVSIPFHAFKRILGFTFNFSSPLETKRPAGKKKRKSKPFFSSTPAIISRKIRATFFYYKFLAQFAYAYTHTLYSHATRGTAAPSHGKGREMAKGREGGREGYCNYMQNGICKCLPKSHKLGLLFSSPDLCHRLLQ